jgi:acyl-CoA thioesterase-2
LSDLGDLLAVLELEAADGDRLRARSLDEGHGVVFGGQLLAQSVVASAAAMPDKAVKSVHTIFARGGRPDVPLDIDVEVMHQGRAFGSTTVTISQDGKLCTRSLVLLHAPDTDLIRHQPDLPAVAAADDVEPGRPGHWWDIRVVDGVDIGDPEAVGPAELEVWTRFPDAPDDAVTSQALLAYASDGFLIGTAMRPHKGVGQSMAHVSISTTVLSHTLTFHEPFNASDWLLLSHESPYAGRGRSYGRAQVFSADGRLVASFVQENMIRDMPESRRPAEGERAKF